MSGIISEAANILHKEKLELREKAYWLQEAILLEEMINLQEQLIDAWQS